MENNKYVNCYIKNDDIDTKWIDNKSAAYNFMVKLAIERAFDLGYLKKDDCLYVVSDNRNISNSFKKSLEEYLISEFILKKSIFKTIKHEYVDSKTHWGVQLADYCSFSNNRKIIYSAKNNKKLPKQFRRVY